LIILRIALYVASAVGSVLLLASYGQPLLALIVAVGALLVGVGKILK
jgi:hypothetical protein